MIGEVGGLAPEGDVDEIDLLDLLAIFAAADTVEGEADLGACCALRGVSELRIAGEIPEEHYFVYVSHVF